MNNITVIRTKRKTISIKVNNDLKMCIRDSVKSVGWRQPHGCNVGKNSVIKNIKGCSFND